MKKPRIPENWRLLHPGEQIHSRMPFHRLEAIAAQMPERRFIFVPSSSGYFIRCEPVPTTPTLTVVK